MDTTQSLHALERKVLPHIKNGSTLKELVKLTNLKEVEVTRAIQWLGNKNIITTQEEKQELLFLDINGLEYKENGLPEKRALKALQNKPQTTQELTQNGLKQDEINIIIGTLKRQNAIQIKKENNQLTLSITDEGKNILNSPSKQEEFLNTQFPKNTQELTKEEINIVQDLKRRKQMLKSEIKKTIHITLTKEGKQTQKNLSKADDVIDKLTPQMLKEKSYTKKAFRPYDVAINVSPITGGRRHFVNEAVTYIKNIWLSLGFTEMQGNMIQTAFWDLDALFVPQDHPARQMQDTFYIKNPEKGKLPDFWKKVKQVHEDGADTGSTGWKDKYDEEVAKLNMLRTHNTVISAQTLAKLKKSDLPAKFFSVGKVFRNEALDYKHLFEFYQVEGIVIDPKANFKNLIGYLKEFFMKMGYLDVRIRPAYFPYTTMSAEVEVLHPTRKTWIELGGSGIFRPEVTKPLLGHEIPVLAWGLGMGRIISEYWKITDIRDLYRNDLKQLKEAKMFLK